jgi:uncharacterized protein
LVRAVLDPNVIISALLSPEGSPARILRAWIQGDFELVMSPLLLDELRRALAYPKLRKRIEPGEADRVVQWLRTTAILEGDPEDPSPVRSPDPGDDYLIALARNVGAALISGEQDLLGLARVFPVFSPARFLYLLEKERGSTEP